MYLTPTLVTSCSYHNYYPLGTGRLQESFFFGYIFPELFLLVLLQLVKCDSFTPPPIKCLCCSSLAPSVSYALICSILLSVSLRLDY